VQIILTDELDRFAGNAGAWLAQSPVDNNVMLSAIAAQREGRSKGDVPATYAWVTDGTAGGAILGAMRWPPPLQARITAMPEAAASALAAELAAHGARLAGVTGPRDAVDAFSSHWQGLTGQPVSSVRRLTLSRLDDVKLTQWPPGWMRQAQPAEAPVLAQWVEKIFADAGMAFAGKVAHQQVDEQMASGLLFVWEDEGHPVAVTGCAAPVEGIVRMTGGFTPPEYRTSWYGTALSAAVAAHFLTQGCQACITISDSSSPQGAAGLRMVGYSPVMELAEHGFQPAS
jgi:predicted GNAT family acetyltransferase